MKKIIAQISTHKAVKENGKISIYQKGLNAKTFGKDQESLEFIKDYPEMFKDELLYTIPLENVDDVGYIMERYDEDNRYNLAEANGDI